MVIDSSDPRFVGQISKIVYTDPNVVGQISNGVNNSNNSNVVGKKEAIDLTM